MPTRQAATVVQTLAQGLRVEADPVLWSGDLRRNGVLPDSLASLADHVANLARRAEITFLRRDLDALDGLLAADALPVLVLHEPAPRAFEAFVLERREGNRVHGRRIGMDGEAAPVEVPTGGAARALAALAREGYGRPAAGSNGSAANGASDANGASGANGAAATAAPVLLVPVSVVPTVGGSAFTAPAGSARAAAAGTPEPGHGHGLTAGEAHVGHDDHHGPSPMARLWSFLLREKRDILLIFGYATLAGLFSLALPLSIQQIVQLVSGRMILQPTYVLVAFVLFGTIVVGALQVAQLRVVEGIQQRVFARLAFEFSFRVPRLRHEVALKEDLPEVMNRFFETVNIQKSLSKLLIDLSTALLTIVFGLILLTLYHPYFTFFSAALVALLGLLFWVTGPKGLETSIMESKYKYRAVHWLEEIARATTAFKYAGRSTLPMERMDNLVSGYLKYRQKHFGVLVQQTIGVIAFKTLVVGTLLVLGIVLVQSNQITLGQFVASEIVIVTVLAGIEKLVLSLATVYDMLTAVDKIGHVTDLPLEPTGGLALAAAPSGTLPGLALETRALSFRYAPGAEPALRDLTLSVKRGERIGITGFEGSGQTTLLKVLGGLMDGFDGSIAVEGVPMRDLDRAAYRDEVGQLLSPTDLFDGTVEENITVGRPHIGPHDVLRALRQVGLGEWIEEQPAGLRTAIGNGGRGLPTHVISRLLVAQAIVGRPRLVVVDDYYQNVEPDCREQLVRCLTDRAQPWTLLLVSHDPAFLAACDRVLVLDSGTVSREGTFAELAEQSAFIQRLLQRGSALRG